MDVPWSKPDIGIEERLAALRVLDSGWVSVGKETREFERELTSYIGCEDAVVFNSGTSALVAALLAHEAHNWCRVKHLPSYTYPATLNAVFAAGGGQYGDFNITDIQYMNISSLTVNAKAPKKEDFKPKDIYIPVSFAGLPLDRNEWGDYSQSMVEDAAESFGAQSRGLKTGNQGWDAVLSFHAAKLITMVEGGAVATSNAETGEALREIRNQGESRTDKGVFHRRGLNLKPSDIHSAIGRAQLRKVDEYLDRRKRVARIYFETLGSSVGYTYLPKYVDMPGNMMFPVFVDEPAKLAAKLKEGGVDTRLGWKPLADDYAANYVHTHIICLPMFNTMRDEEAAYVSEKVLEAMG